MANWITHLMIADRLLQACPALDRRGFCVGNIGPDCNIENADWSAFTPPREVTHWMRDGKKDIEGAQRFFEAYALPCIKNGDKKEKTAFMLGYYTHLITDALFPLFLRNEERIKHMWERFMADETLRSRAETLTPSWENAKRLVAKPQRLRELEQIEAEYLAENPGCGFLTEIVTLKVFPDYLDYLLPGSIVRKVRIMGVIPGTDASLPDPIVITREELRKYVSDTAVFTLEMLKTKPLPAHFLA